VRSFQRRQESPDAFRTTFGTSIYTRSKRAGRAISAPKCQRAKCKTQRKLHFSRVACQTRDLPKCAVANLIIREAKCVTRAVQTLTCMYAPPGFGVVASRPKCRIHKKRCLRHPRDGSRTAPIIHHARFLGGARERTRRVPTTPGAGHVNPLGEGLLSARSAFAINGKAVKTAPTVARSTLQCLSKLVTDSRFFYRNPVRPWGTSTGRLSRQSERRGPCGITIPLTTGQELLF
jgi:hypothetical protein